MSAMDGYIRVSKVGGRSGDSFISPAVQREQIEGWAKMRGVKIGAWHEDLDVSGGKLSRPGLDAMLARLEAGDTAGVVVAKLDRLSRLGVADALKLVERITDAGGTIAALDLGLDPTTPFGEFGMTIMLAMARMERRRIGDSWSVAKDRAIKRGAKIGGTPIGYLKLPGGTLEPDPATAPIVAEAFRRAAEGAPQDALAYLLGAVPAREWNTNIVRRLLGRRVYLGEVHYGDAANRSAHEPIVTQRVWAAAQSVMTMRRPKAIFPLSQIARCASCGEAMVGGRTGKDHKRTYRCRASLAKWQGPRCDAPATTYAEPLEALTVAALRAAWQSGGWRIGGEAGATIEAAETALAEAEAELDLFAADLTARRALGARYHEHLQARAAAVEAAREVLRAEASRDATQQRVLPAELLDSDDPAELRDLFAAGLAAVVVTKGRGPIADRVRVVPHGDDGLSGVSAPQDATAGLLQAV